MRKTLVTAALLLAASAASAQVGLPVGSKTLELRPFVGAYVPTGYMRTVMKDAPMFGLQGAYEHRPNVHFLASFGYVPGTDRFDAPDNGVSLFQYDVGIEYGLVRPMGARWQIKPFLGLGVGGRTYTYADDALIGNTCTAGYGALGTEFQVGRTALRLEARDFVHCFKAPVAGAERTTRNDVALSLGVAYHFR